MAAPKTKEEALQQMRLMWLAIISSIVLYVYTSEMMRGIAWLTFSHAGALFAVLAIFNLYSFSWFRMKRYYPAVRAIQSQPENIQAVRRWMSCWTIILCVAESEAVFGFTFQMGGKTLRESLPFYVVGFLLVLWLWPRPVWQTKSPDGISSP